MERVDEMTVPVVAGKDYLVPTVHYRWFGKLDHWPVLLPRHTDADILNFPWPHYHVDGRFLNAGHVAWLSKRRAHLTLAEVVYSSPLLWRGHGAEHDPHPEPVWRRRRAQVDHIPYCYDYQNSITKLRGAFADKPAPRCAQGHLVCPHKGVNLSNVVADPDGKVICPAHGLRFDPKSGEPA